MTGEIHYSEFNDPDNCEQHKIDSCNVRKYPYPFRFHGTVTAFAIDVNSDEQINNFVSAIYKNAKNEIDLLSTLPKKQEDLINQIRSVKLPSLKKLIFDNSQKMETI